MELIQGRDGQDQWLHLEGSSKWLQECFCEYEAGEDWTSSPKSLHIPVTEQSSGLEPSSGSIHSNWFLILKKYSCPPTSRSRSRREQGKHRASLQKEAGLLCSQQVFMGSWF
jgi:hypothetical protein